MAVGAPGHKIQPVMTDRLINDTSDVHVGKTIVILNSEKMLPKLV